MDPTDAVSLVNLFPTFGNVSRRNGYTVYASGLGGAVKTLYEFNAASSRKFLAAANGNIYDITGGTVTSLASGFTSDAWQCATFQNAAETAEVIFVNGADAPQLYSAGSVGNATISGTGLTVSNLVGCCVFKTRVFYWENASQTLWYTSSGAIAGTLTAFDLGQLSGFGGNIANIATWSRDGGQGPNDYCAIFMTSGDVLIYSGTDISQTSTWGLVGIYRIGAPIGTRCTAKLGPDIAVINKNGFVPLSQVMPGLWNPQEALSNKIVFAAQQAVSAYGSNFGWQMLLYPAGNMAIFNVPVSETVINQYVMNTATGSWCQFQNMNGLCWSLFKDQPFFGGTDGNVYQADNGALDNSNAIMVSGQTSWNYLGDRSRLKRICFVRPAVASDAVVNLGLVVGTDFVDPTAPTTATTLGVGGTPWGSAWGSSWSPDKTTSLPRLPRSGLGNCFSTLLQANLQDAEFDWLSTSYVYEPGANI